MSTVSGTGGATAGGATGGSDLAGLQAAFDTAAAKATERRILTINGQEKVNTANTKVNN